ncbi:transporter [Roseisolibacter agri]|uniref:Transporter n=1 Tax=Roseisolibacter agri TaxID=2014610 RepID=A0AA37VA80_9BACT|nr:transporter [Roseisolibacter agri]GLC25168.1 hypothetical protein rosag_16810 [Roseisolibacter agri]
MAASRAAASLAALASLVARPAAAQTDYYNTDAGRPITVEDAYPVERRALELQLAPLRLERARGGTYHWGVEPEVAVGILPRTQLEVGLPFAFVERGAQRASGLAGVELSVLHNLNVETALPALAVAADVLVPAGGLGPERAYPSVKGIATRTLPWARFHLNGQYTFGTESDAGTDAGTAELSRWQAGVAVDRTLPLRSLLLTGEVVARRPLRADDAAVEWNSGAGARYQLSPRVAADAGAGYRLTGDDRGWYATVGAAVVVGMPWRTR